MLNNLRAELARHGIRQKALAKDMGIAECTLANKIHGRSVFSEPEKRMICGVLGMPVTEEVYAYLFQPGAA